MPAASPDASESAAVAAAVHDVLVHYFAAKQHYLAAERAGYENANADGTVVENGQPILPQNVDGEQLEQMMREGKFHPFEGLRVRHGAPRYDNNGKMIGYTPTYVVYDSGAILKHEEALAKKYPELL